MCLENTLRHAVGLLGYSVQGQELFFMILVDPFQLVIFYDSIPAPWSSSIYSTLPSPLLWKGNFKLLKACFMFKWFCRASFTLRMCFSHPSYLLYSSSFFFQISDFSSSSTVPKTPQIPLSNHLHTRISNSLTCARRLGSFQDHLSHILQGSRICEVIVPGIAFLIKTLLSALCSWFELPLPQY